MLNRTLFREMDQFQRQIDQLFKGMGVQNLFDQAFMPDRKLQQSPRVNLTDEGETFVVSALLPGVAAGDLEVTVQDNTLSLTGERKAEADEGEKVAWHRRERHAGKFLRSIELPVDIDPDRVTAEYRDGILRVTLPKAEAARPKRIEVRTV